MRNKKTLSTLLFMTLILSACGGVTESTGTSSSGTPSSSSSSSESGSSKLDDETVNAYMDNLKATSSANHFYYHYLRLAKNTPDYNVYDDYNQLDVWAFPYKPNGGQGVKFDWVGRTQGTDKLKTATGNPIIDSLGYVSVDIDLKAKHDGGWDAANEVIGGSQVDLLSGRADITEEHQLGFQIVYSATRGSASGFWLNDGGDVHIKLTKYALTNNDGSTSYHAFVVEDNVAKPTAKPVASSGNADDPFKNDDGTNVTYGNNSYYNVDWSKEPARQATSEQFLKTAGVGYQIMVSSFADSDEDGNGDIYGIECKLPYLKKLGVKVIWLTPIQQSDSYHGYDISNYQVVDAKFGSRFSPAGVANGGVVTEETALADYQSLLAAAHENDMLVVMDLVLNHTSVTNNWFISSAKLDPAKRGFYQWGNHLTQSDDINESKFWYPYGSHDYSYYAKFGSSMPELNYAYIDTRTAVFEIADFWADLGVDGFRMDAVKHIFLTDEVTSDSRDTIIKDVSTKTVGGKEVTQDYSSNLTKNLHFWKDLNAHVKAKHPNCFFVGENFDGHAYHVSPFYEGFDSLFDFYSYFNITSIASYYYNKAIGTDTGAFAADAAKYVGNGGADAYTPSQDKDLAGNKSTSMKYGGTWSQKDVFNANNQYRTGGTSASDTNGYSMINGVFTSNHDIARAINRVAGKSYNRDGLTAQGMVDSDSYDSYLRFTKLVEINELMLPGLTWIYYGDEIGMTGNFADSSMTDQSSYADLAYRQPMKWRHGASVGDGSMTTGQTIQGSTTPISWDSVNASTKVVDAETQMNQENSHYGVLASFANYKNENQALINGNFAPYYNDISGDATKGVVSFTRTLGNEKFRVVVNYTGNDVGLSDTGNLVKSYGTASTSSIGRYSAALYHMSGEGVEAPYGIKFSDGTIVKGQFTDEFEGFKQYLISGQEFKAGDVFSLYNSDTGDEWAVNINTASLGGNYAQYLTKSGSTYKVLKDFKADIYIKLKYNQDEIYFGFAS